MKRLLLLICLAEFLITTSTFGVSGTKQARQVTQPDGSKIECFVSGDEYFNFLQDKDGYTIVQASDGYYYYGISENGMVIPSSYKVNEVDPNTIGIRKDIRISKERYLSKKTLFLDGDNRSASTLATGTINNIVVYIKFSDESDFTTPRLDYDNKFNLPEGNSLKSYFHEVSYSKLTIHSTHLPESDAMANQSYTDAHPRSYFEPYNATTNPSGYTDEPDRRLREHTLVKDAVEWLNTNSPVPANLNIDSDDDGKIDNISFIVRGNNSVWSGLLWSHKWALGSFNVYMNNKQVWNYIFVPESQASVTTICHEMFHTLGAPDLYHYHDDGADISPVYEYDIMANGSGHMTSYMKWKYTNQSWIESIPEITESGTYTLSPLTSPANNCYKIASPYSSVEYFVLEYRRSTGTFEGSRPGSGLIVYRVNPLIEGNTDGPPDELYIFRPNGTNTTNGEPWNAYFSQQAGRTTLNDETNPAAFLQNGNISGLNVYNISEAGNTISFSVDFNPIQNPVQFMANAITEEQIELSWQKKNQEDRVLLAYHNSPDFGQPEEGHIYPAGSTLPGGGEVIYSGHLSDFEHDSLLPSTVYYYKLWSADSTISYSSGVTVSASTHCTVVTLPFSESFSENIFPLCWTQQTSGTDISGNWEVSVTNNTNGNANEIKSTWQNRSQAFTRLVSPAINTLGVTELSVCFKYLLNDYGPGAILKIQSSADGINWTNGSWSIETSSAAISLPTQVNTSIATNPSSPQWYLAFTVEGDLSQYNYWYIDDITVSALSMQQVNVASSASPDQGGIVSGTGTYNFGTPVKLVAAANSGYKFNCWSENGAVIATDPKITISADCNREITANFSLSEFNISALTNNDSCGTTTGGGIYNYGNTANITAQPNESWTFLYWSESGRVVSTNNNYRFIVDSDHVLVANFTRLYNISANADSDIKGYTTGSQQYTRGENAIAMAYANSGFKFVCWTENGEKISEEATFSFSVQSDRNLTAVFEPAALSTHGVNENFIAYPNPTQGLLNIESIQYPGCLIENIVVYNAKKQHIFNQSSVISGQKTSIDFSNHPNGIYFVRLNSNTLNEATIKVVVKK